jgi:hypothetical protein
VTPGLSDAVRMTATQNAPTRALPRVDFAGWILRAWPELIVLGAIIIVFAPVLAGTSHFPYDAEFYNYPLLATVQRDLSAGHLPIWDPYTYGGLPLLANAQSAWVYPPHLLLDGILTAAGSRLTEQMLSVLMILHFAAAALLTVRLARRRGLNQVAAAFAGVFVICTGPVIARTEHAGMIETLPWIPLGLILIDDLAEQLRPSRIVGLAVACALILAAGFLPVAVSAFFLFVVWALNRPAGAIRGIGGVMAGILLGGALAGIYMVPIAAQAGVYPLLPVHTGLSTSGVLTAILPNIYGHWQPTLAQYTGPDDVTNSYYYLGGAAIVLAAVALLSSRAARREFLLVVLMFLLSFGAPATWVAAHVQIGAVTRLWRPDDFPFMLAFPLALVVARGLNRAPSGRALGAALLLILALLAIPFPAPNGTAHFLINSPPQTDVACLAALALLALAWRRPRIDQRWLLGGVAVIASVDLMAAVPGLFFVEAQGPTTSAGPTTTGDASTIITYLDSELAPGQRIMANVQKMPPTWNGFADVWQVSDANGFQPQFSRYQLARIDMFYPGFSSRLFPLTPAVRPYMEEMNAPYAVVDDMADPLAGSRDFRRVFTSGVYRVYRARGRFRRAFAVRPQCRPPADHAGVLACLAPGSVSTRLSGQATRTFTLHGHIAEVVTGEVWYPGWRATGNGRTLPVERVGYLTAVRTPAGVKRFTMTYSPPGLALGAIISALAVLLCAGCCARPIRRRFRFL